MLLCANDLSNPRRQLGDHIWKPCQTETHTFCMTPPESLFAGYKQVDAFGPDEDYETEEEICYVTLDLGEIEPSLVPSSSTYRLIVSFFVFTFDWIPTDFRRAWTDPRLICNSRERYSRVDMTVY